MGNSLVSYLDNCIEASGTCSWRNSLRGQPGEVNLGAMRWVALEAMGANGFAHGKHSLGKACKAELGHQ